MPRIVFKRYPMYIKTDSNSIEHRQSTLSVGTACCPQNML